MSRRRPTPTSWSNAPRPSTGDRLLVLASVLVLMALAILISVAFSQQGWGFN